MNNLIKALDRGQVSDFSRNSYEVVFSVFMIALAWFYRGNPQIVYPNILYCFLLLLGSNFVFNYLLRRRASVNLWLLDLILMVNFWTITGVLYYSGGGASYFWVLYLLPVFAASLMAKLKDAAGMVVLCSIAMAVLSWPIHPADLVEVLGLAVKVAVLLCSAWVVFNTAQSKKRAEAGLAFKRAQVEALVKDISEKEVELVKTASAGEIGTLVSGIMHDLGNSVSVILLSAEISAQDERPEKKDLERILKGAKFAKSLISTAMAIVRGQEYVFEQVVLKEAAEAAELLTEYSAKKKNATVQLDFPDGLPAVTASRPHLERLFINTVSNSISFVPEGGKVTVSARPAKDGVDIYISDNGPGFPEKMLNKKEVKAFDTTRPGQGGTGLGLFVCDQIARRHGGRMEIGNLPSGGANIRVYLPSAGPKA